MTDKTEATRLADALTSVVQTYPQMSEDEPGGYCSEVDQIMDEAAALLRRWPDGEPAAPAPDGRVMVPKAPTVEMARDQSERIAALEAKNAELRAANKRAMFAMRDMEAALETERMRLVACGVVALADTPESAASARQMHDDYRSASLTDVIRRVDECIALRAALEQARVALEAFLCRDELNTCQHDDTYRGGAIWTICNECGAKWADDEGGMPEWADPPEWGAALAALRAIEGTMK